MAVETIRSYGEIATNNPRLQTLARLAIEVREKQILIRFGTMRGNEAALIDVIDIMNEFDPNLVVLAGSTAVKQCIEDVTRARLAEKPILMRDDTIWQTA